MPPSRRSPAPAVHPQLAVNFLQGRNWARQLQWRTVPAVELATPARSSCFGFIPLFVRFYATERFVRLAEFPQADLEDHFSPSIGWRF